MPEYLTFEHFARDLMLFSSNFHFKEENSDDLLEPVRLMQDASFIKEYFADGHYEEFHLIFDKTEYQDLQTEEQFFRYAIPRCLNLIDKERYFYSLMLIAAFLHELLSWMVYTRVCHRFHFTAYKCLLAVFKRGLENSFEIHGGFKGLKKYVKQINKKVFSCSFKLIIEHLNEGNDQHREKVIKLIEKCDNFSYESFNLNDYELFLIRDDDIKNIMDLLDSDMLFEDPLDLKWPPPKEEMQEVLEQHKISLSNWTRPAAGSYNVYTRLFDGCRDSESESDDFDSLNVKEDTDLKIYMYEITWKAKDRYGYKIFDEKMKLRSCPCCGIKCYQFSHKLYFKQFDLALIQRIPKWKNSLFKFISYARYRISWFFNPVIIYKRKVVPAIGSTSNP